VTARSIVQEGRDVFNLDYSLKGIPSLINKMKEFMAYKANAADAKKRRG